METKKSPLPEVRRQGETNAKWWWFASSRFNICGLQIGRPELGVSRGSIKPWDDRSRSGDRAELDGSPTSNSISGALRTVFTVLALKQSSRGDDFLPRFKDNMVRGFSHSHGIK